MIDKLNEYIVIAEPKERCRKYIVVKICVVIAQNKKEAINLCVKTHGMTADSDNFKKPRAELFEYGRIYIT